MTRAYIARLNPDGNLDQSFGDRGLVNDELVESVEGLAANGSGEILYAGLEGGNCGFRGPAPQRKFVSLLGDGQFNQGFGEGGGLPSLPNLAVRAIAFDRHGRLLILGAEHSPGGVAPVSREILRLLPDGSHDRSFGQRGMLPVKLPNGADLVSLAVDRRERAVLAGWATKRYRLHPNVQTQKFLLMRTTSGGQVDRGFGRAGFVETEFGPATSAGAEEIVVDGRGRIVVAGPLKGPNIQPHQGLALARYLSGL